MTDMDCEECGRPLLPGEDIVHSASGTVTEDGDLEVGDHFYMHAQCPEEEEPEPKKKRRHRLSQIDRQALDDFKYLLKSKLKDMLSSTRSIWITEIQDLCNRVSNNEE